MIGFIRYVANLKVPNLETWGAIRIPQTASVFNRRREGKGVKQDSLLKEASLRSLRETLPYCDN